MKFLSVVLKSIREQVRSFWILLLSLSMGPFFIMVYFLITESSKPQYNILILNNDTGILENEKNINFGQDLISFFKSFKPDTISTILSTKEIRDKELGIELLKNKKADALIIIPGTFSKSLNLRSYNDSTSMSNLEFIGDLTNINYLISAVWANVQVNDFALKTTKSKRIIEVKEIPLGISAKVSSFDMIVPGILIVSIIMLMFTASIAFVSEVENKTILRLKLSRLTIFEFLGGIGIVQLMVGVLSVVLTLLTAVSLGFSYEGSLMIMLIIAGLTSLSIISFSLIIAAITKSAGEVLVVGNFPMFLFMFFTGAAFPLKSQALFSIAGYPVTIQGLMTPTHSISALNKTLIMNMDFMSIIPEIISILVLSLIYFLVGALLFRRRHLILN
jgi:ABC-2 type transport system permease protein